MTELEKIEYAEMFLNKLANGINPVDDTPVPDGDVASNVRLVRCFAFVSDILRQVVENGRKNEMKERRAKRTRFCITSEQLKLFRYSQEPITPTECCRRLEELVNLSKVKHIPRTSLPQWLVSMGMLRVVQRGTRYRIGGPTEKGLAIGLVPRTYVTEEDATYDNVALLNIEAQRFVVEHIREFLAFRAKRTLSV